MSREEEKRLESEEEVNFQVVLALSPEEFVHFDIVVLSSKSLQADEEEATIPTEGLRAPYAAIIAKGSRASPVVVGPMGVSTPKAFQIMDVEDDTSGLVHVLGQRSSV
ncbi:hypothetical protein ACLOJK_030053 [Asimina triloba]